jgi:hypothetical protein
MSGRDHSRKRLRRFDALMRHPWWGGIGGILALIGIGITLWLAGVFAGGTIHRLRLDEASVSGPLTITPLQVRCNRKVSEVHDAEAKAKLNFAPLKGQLCFVRMQMYDSSVEETQANGSSNLIVNSKAFPGLTSVPSRLPLMFPGTAETITVIYNLPAEVLPSELTVRAARTFQEQGPEWGPYVHYNLTGSVTG